MYALPSLDVYDLQDVRLDELAGYGDDIRYALDDEDPLSGATGFAIAYDCDLRTF